MDKPRVFFFYIRRDVEKSQSLSTKYKAKQGQTRQLNRAGSPTNRAELANKVSTASELVGCAGFVFVIHDSFVGM